MGKKRKSRRDLPARVYFKHNAYYFVDSSKKWHRLGDDFYQAMIAYSEINTINIPCSNMGAILDRYQRDIIPTKAISTQKSNLSEIVLLRGVFGHMQPEDIDPQDIYKYMDARPLVRANREIALFSNVFTKAIRWGYCKENPCKQVERNKETPRDRYVTNSEFWAVFDLAEYNPVLQVAMLLTAITGLRGTDLLQITFAQFTEQGLEVTPSKTKSRTGKKLIFTWTDSLTDVHARAKNLKRKIKSIYVLCNRKGQPYTPSGFKAMWRRLMLKAKENGIEWFQFRDLRAKAGSDHEDGSLLGHSDPKTLERHYRRKPKIVVPLTLEK